MKDQTNPELAVLTKKSESGQAFALMIIVLTVLLGFTALAIDGGMALNDRREGQSGADAAALAGAGAGVNWLKTNSFNCGSTAMNTAVVNGAAAYALKNGMVISEKSLASATMTNGVALENCQASPPQVDIHVRITTESDSFFAQIFIPGPLKSTLDAVVRLRPTTDLGGGYGIVALNPDTTTSCTSLNSPGLNINGGADVRILNSGAFSNSCWNGGNNYTFVSDTPNYYHDQKNGGGTIAPSVSYTSSMITVTPPPTPNCLAAGFPQKSSFPSTGAITYGNYTSGTFDKHGDYTLGPGLYCIHQSFSMNAGATLYALNGVTIYLAEGATWDTEKADTRIVAATSANTVAIANKAIPGLAFWITGNDVKITGGGTGNSTGTFYAPNADVKMTGNSSSIASQFIAKNFQMIGGAQIKVNYDANLTYGAPGWIEMLK